MLHTPERHREKIHVNSKSWISVERNTSRISTTSLQICVFLSLIHPYHPLTHLVSEIICIKTVRKNEHVRKRKEPQSLQRRQSMNEIKVLSAFLCITPFHNSPRSRDRAASRWGERAKAGDRDGTGPQEFSPATNIP